MLAFVIEAWWSERGDRLDERQLLEDLRDELLANRQVLAGTLNTHRRFRASGLTLLELPPGSDALADSAVLVAMRDVFIERRTFNPVGGALVGIAASGDLALIEDAVLRGLLAEWPRRLAENVEDEVRVTSLVDNQLKPYLASKAGVIAALDAPPRLDYVDDLPDAAPLRVASVLTPEGRDLVALRIYAEELVTREGTRLQETISSLLERIEASLR